MTKAGEKNDGFHAHERPDILIGRLLLACIRDSDEIPQASEQISMAISWAKLAHDAGYSFAAADVFCLCEENGIQLPPWAEGGQFINWVKDIRKVRVGKRRGRHSCEMQRIIDNHNQFQHYLAFEEALREGNGPTHGVTRAAVLLQETIGRAEPETIQRHHAHVLRALEEGRASEYWYPASLRLRRLIEKSFNLPVHGSFVPYRE